MSDRVVPIKADRNPPLGAESWSVFHGKDVPEIDWIIPGILVRGGVTLFSGQGGKGKSLLCLQMQAALALGQLWLGMPCPTEPISSLALYCEDDRDILHRRMEDIRAFHDCSFEDLEPARFKSRVGQSNELMRFWGRKEYGEITGFYRQVQEEISLWGCRVLIVDTVADCFGGNENFRTQVRTFVNTLRNLVLPLGGGVILNAHPSRAGLADGSGLSGSTGWQASVRTQVNLTEPKKPDDDDDTEQAPTRDRILKVMKNNYGPSGTKWRLLWDKGVFIRDDMDRGSLVDKLDVSGKLRKVAEYLIERGTFLAATAGTKTSLVSIAKTMPSCKMFSSAALLNAQDRLIADGRFVLVEMGPKSRRRTYVRPAEMSYPGEVAS